MPFTLSHAAVAWPLSRCGLVLSAVVVGSMAPDFEYFLRLAIVSRWGHFGPGILLFSLPAAGLALFLFHTILKQPLLALIPEPHQQRLRPLAGRFVFAPWRRFLLILASLLVGIFTHLALDAFTHEHGVVAAQFAILRCPVLSVGGRTLYLYRFLQYVTSVIGLLVVVYQYWRWYRRAPAPATTPTVALPLTVQLGIVLLSVLIAGILALLYARWSMPLQLDLPSLRLFGGKVFTATVSAFSLELLCFGQLIIWHQRLSSKPILTRKGNGD